jgi:sulfur carrier protein ThiS
MIVTVALYAGLSQHLPPGARDRRIALELPERSTVRDALARLGIPDELPRILVLEGTVVSDDVRLVAGQTLGVFPPLAGGAPRLRSRGRTSPSLAPHREDP